MSTTRILVCMVFVFFLSGSAASAQLSEGPNVKNAWSQGTFEGLRVFYSYTPDSNDFNCRIDFYHDGRIRLLAVQSYLGVQDSPFSSITTFYVLKPTTIRQFSGSELVLTSYKTRSGADLKVEPAITAEDVFTRPKDKRTEDYVTGRFG